MPGVGIHDNFFELGGDSILSIQVTARASRAGLRLATRDLFRHQTIAELATVATGSRPIAAETGPVTGPVPLTPIQLWFLEQGLPEPQHFNQAVQLEIRGGLEREHLATAFGALLAHHDALRLRLVRDGDRWRQENRPPEGDLPLLFFDLSALGGTELAERIEVVAGQVQASLDLARGPLVRLAFFDLGTGRRGRLLIVAHHLVVDGVSWRILLEDLEAALGQLQRGQPIELPGKTTSFLRWSERLAEYAQSGAADEELVYWATQSPDALPGLPLDPLGGLSGVNTVAATQTLELSLDRNETTALLQEVPQAYRTQIDEVLLTALALASREWTGREDLLIDLEGHGREEIFADVDLSRTVGWFTTHFPVYLDLAGATSPREILQTVKEQVRRIPNRGIGYGLLRYLGTNGESLARRPRPEIKFNYLGQVDHVLPESGLLAPAREPVGPVRSPLGERSHLLEIDGMVREHRLHLTFTYSAGLHRSGTVERFAHGFLSALRSIVAHCLSQEAGGFTPSDFPLAQLGQDELDAALCEVDFQERGFLEQS